MHDLKLKKDRFGLLSDGTKVHLYTVTNGKMSFSATEYGCTLTSIKLPSRASSNVDILLGYSQLDGYINSSCCFGTVVGRFANRIGGASFSLDGTTYQLDKNDNGNMLHGGFDRWEKKVWKVKSVKTKNGLGVEFSRTSYDGEQGFPGTVKASVTYTLNDDNVLTLDYKAVTDKATPINLTNHAYFNLKGDNGGSVEDQELQMFSDEYVEVDSKLIPTGKLIPSAGGAFDFTKAKLIGKDIAETNGGYDHCFCVRKNPKSEDGLNIAAIVKDPSSGRKMVVKTTEPGIQLYTGNFIEGEKGKNGFVYCKHGALCLEAEAYPDSPNKKDFPSCILQPGEVYHQVTQYSFEF